MDRKARKLNKRDIAEKIVRRYWPDDVPAGQPSLRARYFTLIEDSPFTLEEIEFLRAIERFKSEKNRPHPTMQDIFKIASDMGYRLVAEPEPVAKRERMS